MVNASDLRPYIFKLTQGPGMRLFMEIRIPVEKGNSSKADGSMEKAIQDFIAATKPEAAYFHLWEGKRAAVFIFEEADQAKLMAHNERLFAALDAEIRFSPTLSLHELMSNM